MHIYSSSRTFITFLMDVRHMLNGHSPLYGHSLYMLYGHLSYMLYGHSSYVFIVSSVSSIRHIISIKYSSDCHCQVFAVSSMSSIRQLIMVEIVVYGCWCRCRYNAYPSVRTDLQFGWQSRSNHRRLCQHPQRGLSSIVRRIMRSSTSCSVLTNRTSL